MSKRISVIAVLAGLWLLLAACGGQQYEPQAINEATDVCVICKMAVKDDQYATQIITKDGQSLKFDDIGCMNKWKQENGTETIGAAFVRDYNSKQWLRYEKAYYAYDSTYKTPMAYGIVSFEKEADAKAFIDEQGKGKLMTAEELANHSWEVNRDMMNMGGMGKHGHSPEGGGMDQHGQPQEGAGTDKHGQQPEGGGMNKHGQQPEGEGTSKPSQQPEGEGMNKHSQSPEGGQEADMPGHTPDKETKPSTENEQQPQQAGGHGS